jgi:hypothetical protein
MKTLILESCPSITRWAVERDGIIDRGQSFRLWGRRNGHHSKWLWTDGMERLTAFEDDTVSVAELWARLLDHDKVERHEDASILVSAAFSEICETTDCQRVVFIIPESLPETSQNALMASLSAMCRIPQREVYLLWRSVALGLVEVIPAKDSSPRVILDYGHLVSEFTKLDVAHSKGHHCPVRDFSRGSGLGVGHLHAMDEWILQNYLHDASINSMRLEGFEAAAYEKLQADLNFDPPAAWKLTDNRYETVSMAHDDFSEPINWDELIVNLERFLEQHAILDEVSILWHGWPVYWHGEDVIRRHYPSSKLLESDAALLGGVEFAKRHRLRQPTYFELIPGYEIWCQVSELGLPKTWRWETLIPREEISGTETFEAPLNERFKLTAGTLTFDMNVRVGGSQKYRFVEQALPSQILEDTSIFIKSEIRPTGGGVKFSLRSKDQPDLFGRNSELALRWDRAEERDVDELSAPENQDVRYSYPFIIQSQGDAGKRDALETLAQSVSKGGGVDHALQLLDQIMVPSTRNQYEIPFGNRKISSGISEPYLSLISEINNFCEWHIRNVQGADRHSWKWVRIVSSLFWYTSEENQRHIYEEVMRRDFPLNDVNSSSLFWSMGRVCRDPKHFEEYLKKALSSWDDLAGMHYWLFWPFAKSLCCYGESVKISRDVAFSVFECASQMLDWIITDDVPTVSDAFGDRNWKKWTLGAILYGLRIREIFPDFLSFETGPSREREIAVKLKEQLEVPSILLTKIPKFALKGIDIGDDDPRLGALVLKFLEARADAKDIALAGGIGLSS